MLRDRVLCQSTPTDRPCSAVQSLDVRPPGRGQIGGASGTRPASAPCLFPARQTRSNVAGRTHTHTKTPASYQVIHGMVADWHLFQVNWEPLPRRNWIGPGLNACFDIFQNCFLLRLLRELPTYSGAMSNMALWSARVLLRETFYVFFHLAPTVGSGMIR